MTKIFASGPMDRKARHITWIWLVIIAVILLLLWLFWGEGGYILAWGSSLFAAVLLLYIMSIPRKVIVSDMSVEIRCVVESVNIKFSDLRTIRRIQADDMKRKYVLLGSYGFFGYYGCYLEPDTLETLNLYCKQWDNFVEITDVFERRYVVSVLEPDELVAAATHAVRFYSDSNAIE